MGYRLPCLSICLALSVQGALYAEQASWEHNMNIALEAAARHDYTVSENYFAAAIRELEIASPDDPRLGASINSLGLVYRAENKPKEAEGAFRRALVIIEKTNHTEGIDVGNVNFNLGSVLVAEGKYNQSEAFLQKALRIFSRHLGEKSPKSAAVMGQLGEAYRHLQDNEQAESLLKKALDIEESARGIDDPNVAGIVNSLAELYASEDLNRKAEPMFKLVMSIRESTAGMDSPEFAAATERYAISLEKVGRFQEAQRHQRLAAAVRILIAKKSASAPVQTKGADDMMAPNTTRPSNDPAKKTSDVARVN